MAISKSFFGLRKKSTKSHTYSVYEGQQVTKDRVTEVKNPRSSEQMQQRAIMSTVVAGYSAMKEIVNHSWQGVTYGAKSMNKFYKVNADLLRRLYEDKVNYALNAYGNKAAMPLPFIMSSGSIQSLVDRELVTYDESDLSITLRLANLATAESKTTLAAILKNLGISENGYITICYLSVMDQTTQEFNGITQSNNSTFSWVRMHPAVSQLNAEIDQNTKIDTVFAFEGNNDRLITEIVAEGFSLDGTTLKITTHGYGDACCVILSDKVNDVWQRSSESLTVRTDAVGEAYIGNYANVIASYPTGNGFILNGSNKE